MNEASHFLAWFWNVTMAKSCATGRTPTGRLAPDAWRGYLGAIRIKDAHIRAVTWPSC
ncbi:hypothetical protein [Microbispora triticiradicis]|uniref:hypothetical protein n=1 Tax=Microbispora triticiradicis TaxID=2200763 RepID=UPI001404C935|nr:hypothetical protein [Microbispora triticiradicis]